jgi:hypothetical protein
MGGDRSELLRLVGARDERDLAQIGRRDAEAAIAHRDRVLARPETDEERRVHEEFLARVRGWAEAGADLSDFHRQVVAAERDLREYLGVLAHIEAIEPERAGANAAEVEEYERQHALARRVVANAYWRLGEFERAVDYADSPEEREVYVEYLAADQLPDDLRCDCPKLRPAEELVARAGGTVPQRVENNTEFVEAVFPSPTRNHRVHAIRCTTCRFLNLRPDLTETAEHELTVTRSTSASHQILAPRGGGGGDGAV